MIIYRVENDDGKGMYRDWDNPMQDIGNHHPLPQYDVKLDKFYDLCDYERTKYVFGFVNLEQLKFWIYKTEWKKLLQEKGFHIHIYKADEYFLGDTQAVFIRHVDNLVNIMEFDEL